MPRVSKEQIHAANRMTAIEFLRRYRPGSLVKSSARGEYQLAEHDSFKINGESSVWHWKSRDIGGKSALKYLIYVEGVPFVEAVQLLCEESPMYIPVQHEAVERERPPFRLPNPAPNNDRVTRYLLGRGISLPTIRYCIARKILYESAEYHNCVFLGKDPQGVPKYAALRGIYDYGKPFKREAPGSQKQYGFCIPPMQPGTTVAVFEAAIDAMAEMTLCGDAADKYRLSAGRGFILWQRAAGVTGTSAAAPGNYHDRTAAGQRCQRAHGECRHSEPLPRKVSGLRPAAQHREWRLR